MSVSESRLGSRQQQFDEVLVGEAAVRIADYSHSSNTQPLEVMAFTGGSLRYDPQVAARFMTNLTTKFPALLAPYQEQVMEATGSAEPQPEIVDEGSVMKGGWQLAGEYEERYRPISYNHKDYWLIEQRSLRQNGKLKTFKVLLASMFEQAGERQPNNCETPQPEYVASLVRAEDAYTGAQDYQKAWEVFSASLKPGTTQYLISLPVVEEIGNRPSVKFCPKEDAKQIPASLEVTFTEQNAPIVIRIAANEKDDLFGYPVSKDHNYGQATEVVQEPQFKAFEAVLLPGKDLILIGRRPDGTVARMAPSRSVEIGSIKVSGLYSFIAQLLVRMQTSIRHTKAGVVTNTQGEREPLMPLLDLDELSKRYFKESA